MTLLMPPTAPLLGAALDAIERREPDAAARLAAAVKADEQVLVPLTTRSRDPLLLGHEGLEFLSAFTSPWRFLWGQPWRPVIDLAPVRQVLAGVLATGRLLHLDYASEADTCIGPEEALALLTGRPVSAEAIAAGDQYRNPDPPAPFPTEVLPTPMIDEGPGELIFARQWDTVSRQPVDVVTREDLAALDAGYAVVRRRGGGLSVVRFGTTVLMSATYVDGMVFRWEWARFPVGLFLTETGMAIDDGSPQPRAHVVTLGRPDGLTRSWTDEADDDNELITTRDLDVLDRWLGMPPLGNIELLVGAT